jgi:hypothetical protein
LLGWRLEGPAPSLWRSVARLFWRLAFGDSRRYLSGMDSTVLPSVFAARLIGGERWIVIARDDADDRVGPAFLAAVVKPSALAMQPDYSTGDRDRQFLAVGRSSALRADMPLGAVSRLGFAVAGLDGGAMR